MNTAGQYENNNFSNAWSIPNLIFNDSENLNINFMEECGRNNKSILNTQNKFGQGNFSFEQNSSPLFLNQVFEISDNFINNQNANSNIPLFPEKYYSEKQISPSTRANQEFYNGSPQCETMGLTPENFIKNLNEDYSILNLPEKYHTEKQVFFSNCDNRELYNGLSQCKTKVLKEHFPFFNINFIKSSSTIATSDSNNCSSNLHSAKHILNEPVSKYCIPVNGNSTFETTISYDGIRKEADSSQVKTKKRGRTVFTNAQLKTLNMAFKRSHYLNPEILDQLAQSLKLPKNVVKIWFCNKRAIWKKQKKICDTNLNQPKSISTNCEDSSVIFAESPKNAFDQNSNKTENSVENPKNYAYVQKNRKFKNPQPDCPPNFLHAHTNKQNCLENNYSFHPVELDEAKVLCVAPNANTISFDEVWM